MADTETATATTPTDEPTLTVTTAKPATPEEVAQANGSSLPQQPGMNPAPDAPKLVGVDGSELKSELPPEKDWQKHKFPIELFENRIAIKRDDREEMVGLIHLPPNARERVMTGTVVGVGPGMKKGDGTYVPMLGWPEQIKLGDRIVFEQFRQMISVEVEGRSYHITRDTDLIGRIGGFVKVKKGD